MKTVYKILAAGVLIGTAFTITQKKVTPQKEERSEVSEKQSFKKTGAKYYSEYHARIRQAGYGRDEQYPAHYQYLSWKKQKQAIRSRSGEELPWIHRGPGNVGGRTRGIWVDPTDPSAESWFVGSAGGGIWKTTDGGESWEHITADLPNLSTSTIVGSKKDPNILYVGTGEGFDDKMITGSGIWKSTDKGVTWNLLESTSGDSRFGNIMRIVVNPEDPDELVICTNRNLRGSVQAQNGFIFKSTDGGQSWTQTLSSSTAVQQIVFHPDDFNTQYASVNSDGIFKSTDGGQSWTQVHTVNGIRRMELAIAPTEPNFIYFSAETNGSELYYSKDAGNTWAQVRPLDNQNDFGDWFGGQGFFDNTIAVHPYNHLKVYVGGAGPILSIEVNPQDDTGTLGVITDGYQEYAQRFPEVGERGVHVDHHNIVLIPRDSVTQSFYFLNANDGGVAFSKDGGNTFKQTGDTFKETGELSTLKGYNTSQFYGIDKANGSDRYVGGTQDNGSWVSPENPDGTSEWSLAPSGDGFEAAWHYDNPNLLIESSQFNSLFKSKDGGQTWTPIVSPPGPFLTRVANSKQDPDLVFIVTDQGIAASGDFGDTWKIANMPPTWNFNFYGNPLEVSLASPLVVWSGNNLSATDRMAVSIDGGDSFSETQPYTKATLGEMVGIATHPFKDSTAYALFGNPQAPKIVRTDDLGQSWYDISGFDQNGVESKRGFPDVVAYTLIVMPYDTNIIWVGTDIGLIESTDGGASWALADNGMPPLPIFEMKIVNNEVIVATHGQGIWTVEIPELDGYEPPLFPFSKPSVQAESFDLKVFGRYNLKASYDSTFLKFTTELNGQQYVKTEALGSNDTPEIREFELDFSEIPIGDTIVGGQLTIESYTQGKQLSSTVKFDIYDVDNDVTFGYASDFDDGAMDFARNGFNIYQDPSLHSISLQTAHPYPDVDVNDIFNSIRAIFQKPILVHPNGTRVNFDEIALIEPGDSPDPFDPSFYDYVAIEGSADKGKNWKTIARYDAQAHTEWKNAFESNSANPELYKPRSFLLNDYFNEGDTVFLRFRLFADAFINGWGWSIDNLTVDLVTSTKNVLAQKNKMHLFPNPVGKSTTLRLDLEKDSQALIEVYQMDGKLVRSVHSGPLPAGQSELKIQMRGLPAGNYFVRANLNGQTINRRFIKI